jgi:hypothetical protein
LLPLPLAGQPKPGTFLTCEHGIRGFFAMRAFRPFNRTGVFHVLDRLADRA